MAQLTPHLERDSSRQGWTPTKPDPMSIGTDRLMALVRTRMQGLNQDSLTSIVCTSGGSSFWWLVLNGLAISERHCRGVRRCMLLRKFLKNPNQDS
jgi:hypothetical protein